MFVVQRYSLMLESAGGLLHREHGPRQRQGATAAAKPAANQTVDDAMRSGAALPSCGWQWPACSPLGRLWICRLRGRSRYHVTVDVCGTVLRGAPGRPRDRRALALGGEYDGIIVTNYLHRPLLPAIARALTAGGTLTYGTFTRGNGSFGTPRSPDFLLRPGELFKAFTALTVVVLEQGQVSIPRPAVIQRLAPVRGPMGSLPV